MTDIYKSTPALLPRRQLMAQVFAAMVKSGLRPQDLKEMKADTHAAEIVAFTDSIMSCGHLDQVSVYVCCS